MFPSFFLFFFFLSKVIEENKILFTIKNQDLYYLKSMKSWKKITNEISNPQPLRHWRILDEILFSQPEINEFNIYTISSNIKKLSDYILNSKDSNSIIGLIYHHINI